MTVEEALQIYNNDSEVEFAEPNYYRHATAVTPDDIHFDLQWALDNRGQKVAGTRGTTGADIEAREARRVRTLGPVPLKASALRKGVNVLALEFRRTNYDPIAPTWFTQKNMQAAQPDRKRSEDCSRRRQPCPDR